MLSPASVVEELNRHIESFVESPHPALLGQPVCPFARRARKRGQVRTVVVPFSVADDSAVQEAVEEFDPQFELDVLLVVHPEADGIGYFDLTDMRTRYAETWAGEYEVFTGHPDDPFTRAGLLTRQEPYPVLHFVRSDRIIEAEAQLSDRRRAHIG